MSSEKQRAAREPREQARQAGREVRAEARRMAKDVREEARQAALDQREAGREPRQEHVDPIWSRPEPGARRAGYTREQLARTALAIADAEGFEAVSMRRVASELGAGTMTLYHYVRNKDELVELMGDEMMGELLVPDDEMPSDWREALTAIARRSRGAWERHPWAKDAPPGASIGPNAMHHFDQSLAAVANTGLDTAAQFAIIGLVDEWVLGYALRDTYLTEGADGRSALASEWTDALVAYIDAQLATGEFPHFQRVVGDEGTRAALENIMEMMQAEDRFERGLGILLDGIALDIERQRKKK
jgi:AcrR family transcriptional regulator